MRAVVRHGWVVLVLGLLLGVSSFGAPVPPSAEPGSLPIGPIGVCQLLDLAGELPLYKDPTMFLSYMAQLQEDPEEGWFLLEKESPLLSPLTGKVGLRRLGDPVEFSDFGLVGRFYELAEPRLQARTGSVKGKQGKRAKVVPVAVCGKGQPYAGTMGFVLLVDLEDALHVERDEDAGMPPSTLKNPIPRLEYK